MANWEVVCCEINYAIIGVYVKPVVPGVPASLTAAAPVWLHALVASPAAPTWLDRMQTSARWPHAFDDLACNALGLESQHDAHAIRERYQRMRGHVLWREPCSEGGALRAYRHLQEWVSLLIASDRAADAPQAWDRSRYVELCGDERSGSRC